MRLVLVIFSASFSGATAVRSSVETDLQSNMSADMQAGSLFDNQYVLLSKLATTDWPRAGVAGFTGMQKLGEGAFGETWLVKDQTGQTRALKFFYRDEGYNRVLLNKGNAGPDMWVLTGAAAECSAPDNIIAGGSSGQNRFARCIKDNSNVFTGASYVVMELAGNQNLGSYLRAKPAPSIENVFRISRMLVEGLAQLQESKYVHRDIKPDNIMLTVSGRDVLDLKFIDFGLTRKITQSDYVSGTPLYMPPELWPLSPQGKIIPTHQHDIYSVGETIFEIVCGKTFHEQILDQYYAKEVSDKKGLLETENKMPRCKPPRASGYLQFDNVGNLIVEDGVGQLLVLAGRDMMATQVSQRASGKQILEGNLQSPLSKALWQPAQPVKQVQQKPVQQKPVINFIAPQEESLLKKCHASKAFWFANLVKCCTEEKPDDLRNVVCEKPCGGNVGYTPGKDCFDETRQVQCGSDKKRFIREEKFPGDTAKRQMYCCVDKTFPQTCDYVGLWNRERRRREPKLPEGKGWLWMR